MPTQGVAGPDASWALTSPDPRGQEPVRKPALNGDFDHNGTDAAARYGAALPVGVPAGTVADTVGAGDVAVDVGVGVGTVADGVADGLAGVGDGEAAGVVAAGLPWGPTRFGVVTG